LLREFYIEVSSPSRVDVIQVENEFAKEEKMERSTKRMRKEQN